MKSLSLALLCVLAGLRVAAAQTLYWDANNLGASLASHMAKGGSVTGGCTAGPFVDSVTRAAQISGLSSALISAVMQIETGGMSATERVRAVSPKGAIGPMQLLPGTASDLGVDPWNASDNIVGGARYLASLMTMFGGDLRRALMAYNAGPGAVQNGGGVPSYAAHVMANMQNCHGGTPAMPITPGAPGMQSAQSNTRPRFGFMSKFDF